MTRFFHKRVIFKKMDNISKSITATSNTKTATESPEIALTTMWKKKLIAYNFLSSKDAEKRKNAIAFLL